jgi:hypothetical protein
LKLTDVSEVRTASIIRAIKMMEAVCTSGASVNPNGTTRRYISEDSKLLRLRMFELRVLRRIFGPC